MLKKSWDRLMTKRKTQVWNDGFGKSRNIILILAPYVNISQNTLVRSFSDSGIVFGTTGAT